MSNVIDNKIVELTFKNGQFEKAANESLSTLDKLKKAVSFKGVSEGFNNITKAANKVTFGLLTTGISKVQADFSAMEVVVNSALANITNSAVNAGKRIINALTLEPVTTGFTEYETKINATQVIAANTGALEELNRQMEYTEKEAEIIGEVLRGAWGNGADRLKALTDAGYDYEHIQSGVNAEIANAGSDSEKAASSMEDINRVLEEMNTFADKTIYNFPQMTNNLGKFVAAGMGLDEAATAITGMAALAAVSGASAEDMSRATYQMSQAMAAGVVKLQDWNSLKNANMANARFKEELKKTAKEHGVAIDDMIEKEGSFEYTLQNGWLTSDIFSETLAKYTDETTELGSMAMKAATEVKTISQLWDTLKESVQSGWTTSWEYILGDFVEAKDLLTGINNTVTAMLQPISDARNEALKYWHDNVYGRDRFVEALKNLWTAINQIASPIKEAFNEMFGGVTGKNLVSLTNRFYQFTRRIQVSEDAITDIKKIATGFFSVIKLGVNVVKQIVSAIGNVIKSVSGGTGNILDLGASVGDTVASFADWVAESNVVEDVLTKIFNFIRSIPGKLKTAASQAKGFIYKLFGVDTPEEIEAADKAISDFVTNITTSIGNFIGSIADGSAFSKFSGYLETIKQKFSDTTSAANDTTSVLDKMKEAFIGAFNTIKARVEEFSNPIVEAFTGEDDKIDWGKVGAFGSAALIIASLVKIFTTIRDVTDDIKGLKDTIIEGIQGIFDGIKGVFTSFQNNMKAQTILTIAISIGILVAALWLLTTVEPERLESALSALTTVIIGLAGAFITFSKVLSKAALAGKTLVGAAALVVAFAIGLIIFAVAFEYFKNMEYEDLVKGALSVVVVLKIMMKALKGVAMSNPEGMTAAAVVMVGMAIAVRLIAGAMTELAKLDVGGLVKASVALVVITGCLSAMVKSVGKMQPDKMIQAGVGLVIMSVAMGLIAAGIVALSVIPVDNLLQGVGVMAAAFLAMVGLIGVMSKFKPEQMIQAGIGLLLMSVAMDVLVGSIGVMAMLPLKNLGGAIGAFAVVGGIIAGIIFLMGKFKPEKMIAAGIGLILMSVAMTNVMTAIGALALVDSGKLESTVNQIIKLAAVLAAIVVVITYVKGVIGGSGGGGFKIALNPFIVNLLLLAAAIWLIADAFSIGVKAFNSFRNALLAWANTDPNAIAQGFINFSIAITLAAPAILQALQTLALLIVGSIGALLLGIAQAIDMYVPDILIYLIDALTKCIWPLLDFLLQLAGPITERIIDILVVFVLTLANGMDRIVDALIVFLIKTIDALADSVEKRKTEIARSVAKFIWAVVDLFIEAIVQFVDVGQDVVTNLMEGFDEATGGALTKFFTFGSDIIDGIWNGIKEKWEGLKEGIKSVGDSLLSVFGITIDSNSPSKEFAKLGSYIPQGIAMGINQDSDTAMDAIGGLADDSISAFNDQMQYINEAISGGIGSDFTITPVLDLTNVEEGATSIHDMLGGLMTGASVTIPDANTLLGQATDYSGAFGSGSSYMAFGTDSAFNAMSGFKTTATLDTSSVTSALLAQVTGLRGDTQSLKSAINGMAVNIDGKALVGAITAPMNRSLGVDQMRKKRGI